MQTADFDVHSFEQSAQSEEDKKLLVKFFMRPRPDAAATIAEGRPIFHDIEYVDIKIPGDRTGGACRPATHRDKQRFAEHYRLFKQRIEVPIDGTPLAEWPLVTRSLAEELAFHNVKTVEHLATMADVNVGKFMGLGVLKAKAVKWLEQSSEESKVHALQEQLAERDERIDRLEEQMEKMLAMQAPPEPVEVSGQDPEPVADTPSLASKLDEPAPVRKARRRRVKKADGTVQDSK